ncbi:MAG TPA: HDOD domain-containing protein [Deltaproteobacteria bacterium]|nr:HDOD domain-containing protein [Deltaproteobacteria bacterium]HPR53819.1 HDOD domain-containing protein [Deltaproteobacteria bacterium]HXK45981.1 HDOD domain-containing protein [Deltaproteobacteria bacterium]
MESNGLMGKIGRSLDGIPTLESSRMRIFQVLQDEETPIERIEQVVSSDPAMAAKVIKLANSAFYRHADGHVGIQQALRTIGLDMVKCIALSMAVMETFGNETSSMKELWRHSHAVALISGLFGGTKPEKECLFTGGLLHDLGRMVLMCGAPNEYRPVCDFSGYWPDPALERDVFGLDHCAIGKMVAERWHFPPDVILIIAHHHEPVDRLTALVGLTDQIIGQHERGIMSEELEGEDRISLFLGPEYKNLVNTIRDRYRTNTTVFEILG